MTPDNDKPILIAGLGNALMRDDGIGVHAVSRLRRNPPEGVVLAEIGGAVLGALDLFENARYIVLIDAMRGHGVPGTVYECAPRTETAMERPTSLHELSILGALEMRRNPTHRPEVVVLGIEPGAIGHGMDPSPEAEAALPEVERLVRRWIANWTEPTEACRN